MKKLIKDFDFTLIFAPLILTCFGVVMIYSASMVYAVVKDVPADFYLWKQIKWVMVGLVVFLFTMHFPYQKYHKLMLLIVGFMASTLVLVLIFGKNVGGANSWFDFGPISFQPSEVAKLGLIMYLASAFAKKQKYIGDFARGVVPPLTITVFVLGLIVLQPDLGTATIIFMIACTMIISSGVKYRHIFLLGMVGLIFFLLVLPSMSSPERISRFQGAYQPFADEQGDGYHLIQSYISIGTGGLTGEGLGQSVQKLGYLLEPHTDFIMAIVAEELGLIGVTIVIGLLFTIIMRGLYISRKCKDAFGSLLAIGISSMLGIQAFVNLGAISGVLPITGVPLPFVSYGGSSLVVLMASVGILNNIAKQVNIQRKESFATQPPKTSSKPRQSTYQRVNTKGGKPWVK